MDPDIIARQIVQQVRKINAQINAVAAAVVRQEHHSLKSHANALLQLAQDVPRGVVAGYPGAAFDRRWGHVLDELRSMLQRGGFTIVSEAADFAGTPLDERALKYVVVCRTTD